MIAEWRRTEEEIEQLSEILHACVHDGASVSFILPFSMDDARGYWRGVRNRVLTASIDGHIAGTVQVILETPPNQQHRAEIAKLLVHPAAQRRGLARSLMTAAEQLARAEQRMLITLDTRTGDRAEPLYLSMGYQLCGRIPGYARGPYSAELEATSILYKQLT